MTESTAPKVPAKPPATPVATPVVPSANGATPPADAAPEAPIEVIEFIEDRRLAVALLLIGIGVGAAVVWFVLTRVIIEDET